MTTSVLVTEVEDGSLCRLGLQFALHSSTMEKDSSGPLLGKGLGRLLGEIRMIAEQTAS